MAAISANNAWAVGSYDDGNGGASPLILHWNGSAWQSVAAPRPAGANEVTLTGIAASSASDIWAVGSYTDPGGSIARKTLILRWNGAQWQIAPSPNPQSFLNGLNSVTAISANDAWAVGYSSDGGGYQTLALHWNGASWQVASSPSPGDPNNELLAVVAGAANDVWATGYSGNSADDGQPLALHWNGASWQAVAQPSSAKGTLNALDVLANGPAWAVGANTATSVAQSLVERYWVTSAGNPGPNQSYRVLLPLMRR